MAALAILLQAFGVKGFISSCLPVMVGSGFAFLPTLRSIVEQYGMSGLAGAQIAGAVMGMVVGLVFKKIRFLFPPIVTGSVVLTIGISLYDTAVNYMAGVRRRRPPMAAPATGFWRWSRWSRSSWRASSAKA